MNMKTYLLPPSRTALLAAMLALASAAPAAEKQKSGDKPPAVFPETQAKPDSEVRVQVQITEIGCMRTLLVLTPEAKDLEKLVAQRLTDVDFRVFPSAQIVGGAVSAEKMLEIGKENRADLVLMAGVTTRVKNKFGEFQINEGEATVLISNPRTGELLTTQTSRVLGERNLDAVDAERSSREKALDMAVREAIEKGLEKAHKNIVHLATITNVKDNSRLLVVKEHIAKMDGVYHVRQISFDAAAGVAELEIIASPKAEEFWRAWLEKLPRTIITVTVKPPAPRKPRPASPAPSSYPSWYK
jgi:hypothetical protein